MQIVSFDLGLANLGTSVITNNLEILFSKNFTTNSKTEYRFRLREIEVFVNQVFLKYNPTVLVYEKNYCQLTDAGSALINVEGILLTTSTKYTTIETVTNYSAKQVKKLVSGNGNSSKEEMITTANKLFNITNKNNHIADSLLIGYCYLLDNKLVNI